MKEGMDEKALQFHIQANDCLGNLATIVDLVRQALKKKGAKAEIHSLEHVRDELMHLQNCYRLEKREQASSLTVHLLSMNRANEGDGAEPPRLKRTLVRSAKHLVNTGEMS